MKKQKAGWFPPFKAHKGKLDKEDSRNAYVTAIMPDGRRAPVASFWSYSEAIRYAKEANKESETK